MYYCLSQIALKLLSHYLLSIFEVCDYTCADITLLQMLRSSLKISPSDISAIDSQESFWEFFDVLVEKLFQTEWYNGKVINCLKFSPQAVDFVLADLDNCRRRRVSYVQSASGWLTHRATTKRSPTRSVWQFCWISLRIVRWDLLF